MAPRPYWKGYLKLALVSCPIALSPATSSTEKVSFRQVNKETGNRIRYKKVDSETDEEVSGDQIGKGNIRSNSPAPDSAIMDGKGNGTVDDKKLKTLAEKWGTMPEKDRAKAIMDIVDPVGGVELDLPPRTPEREPPRFDWDEEEP